MIKRKTMLLAAAALSALAFTALPSIASAEFNTTPSVSTSFPNAYSGNAGAGTLYTASGRKVSCTGGKAEGAFTSSMEGTAKVTFSGCKESTLNSNCTTAGQSTGVIVTEVLPTHTVYLAGGEGPHDRPGVLFTPNANGTFATFSCVGGFVKIVVKGNGVLGTAEPGIGVETEESTIDVSATAEAQEHTETVDGTTYGLESNTNGGAFEPAYQDAGPTTVELEAPATTTT